MRKLLLLLFIIFVSCLSDDDNSNQTTLPNIVGLWTLSSITFEGNGTSGTGDSFFYGSQFDIELIANDRFLGPGNYPNGAGGQFDVILLSDNNLHYLPIDDTGAITSNSITTNYNLEIKLIDVNDNEITLLKSHTPCEIERNGDAFTVDFNIAGYNITHTYTR